MVSPSVGFFKVNFDAYWVNEYIDMACEIDIRDHRGKFYAGICKVGPQVTSAEVAECIAAREMVLFVLQASFRNIILECDNLGVVNAIRDNEDGLGLAGAVLADINKVRIDFNSFCVSFVTRTGNTIAYALARRARSDFVCEMSLEEPPDWQLNVLLFDCNSI